MRLSISRQVLATVAFAVAAGGAGLSPAAMHDWDGSIVEGTYSWFNPDYWIGSVGGVPVNGNSVDFETGNTQRTFDVNNGGAGVNLSNSTITFGRGIYLDSSAGGDPLLADDAIVADVMNINGAGGSSPVFDVPLIANTMTSNRHGGVFNREITVNQILAQSGHQDHWQINVSPTGPIDYILFNENRGADGDGNVESNIAINADTMVTTFDFTYGRVQIGAGATVDVDTFTIWDYTNQATNNNITPLRLFGDMNVDEFNVFDVASQTTTQLLAGTYGAVGNANVNFQVPWIDQGDGVLSVGQQIPEPSSIVLAGLGLIGLAGYGMRRRKRVA